MTDFLFVGDPFRFSDDIANATNKTLGEGVQRFFKSKNSIRSDLVGNLNTFHRQLGLEAQLAMVEAYSTRPRTRTPASYRMGDRYSGGVLLAALSDSSNVQTTNESLNFIDENFMDSNAPQWRRLTFGTGKTEPDSNPKLRAARTRRFIREIPMGRKWKPSKAFYLPGNRKGTWVARRDLGGIWVGPPGRFPNKPSGPYSIKAQGFVQEGVKYITENYASRLADIVEVYLEFGE